MDTKILLSTLLIVSLLIFSSCGTKVAPVSERIAKIYTASSVKENGSEVFNKTGTSNIKPGYGSYKMDLSSPPKVSIKDVDGGTYTGTYSVTATELTINGLTPQPTGTSGNLNFTITTLSDTGTELILTAKQTYPKTGNTTNVYTLVSSN
jgi:hypothetical protein